MRNIEKIAKVILAENVYYHGSPYKFDSLKKDVGRKTGGDEYGYGIYLTYDKSLAEHYAKENGYVYVVRIPNLNFIFDDKRVSKSNSDRIRNIFVLNDMFDNNGEKMGIEHKTYMINSIIKDSKNGLDLYKKILRVFPISDKQLSEMMDKAGIGGIVGNNGKETVVFNPSNAVILDIL